MTSTSSWRTKTFTATTTDIHGLVLQTRANFVTADPTASVATVTFRTDSDELLNAIRIDEVDAGDSRAISIGFDRSLYRQRDLEAAYIVDIALPPQALSYLEAVGNVVVGPRVLSNATSDSIQVLLTGSGDVYVDDSTIVADRLQLTLQGSGDLQFAVPSLHANAVDVSVQGSGDCALFSTVLETKTLDVNVFGSGSVFASGALSGNPSVTTDVDGSGDVKYTLSGDCSSHEIAASASGDAKTSSLACATTSARASGSGDIYASASTSFSASADGSGDVYYVGPAVPTMSGKYHTKTLHSVDAKTPHALPQHVPATIRISSHGNIYDESGVTWPASSVDNDTLQFLGLVLAAIFIYFCIVRKCCRSKKRSAYDELPMVIVVPGAPNQAPYYQSVPQYAAPPQLVVPQDTTYGKV
ncbi:hypothetical protein SDRG_02918 [Saprolegnia diclina VS20]|uniref:Putative auto-transporter adhesin head GIN domain-containing protein n=1 Tax=Saprolegnia diclina (strain VS20) TaxID=1156394 RepID=T0QZM7_SAPDV|nr:hypothetical protein SDRG_02918 [Saprolegnia diclina VS20]EQC39475.1 hypothetical protein SDRG_02918 [Saprolegnia diclina VS20]|eukprot:XP_008606747.1 hypothetical protein SDRG_02918 [Saprolegnia diclina VS20]